MTAPPLAPQMPIEEPLSALPEGGSDQVSRVLEYLAFVAKSKPLSLLLDEAPRMIAACVGAEVASLYLLEGDGHELVLRGNIGFPGHARGQVRLKVGEGLTGVAVEKRYPITSASAPKEAGYRGFPELDEERYPVFMAVPILGRTGPLGAVVLQRRCDRPFSEATVSLVAALTAPISSGIRLARLLDDMRQHPRQAGGGTRKVTLPGEPLIIGRAMGALAALRRPATSPRQDRGQDPAAALRLALEHAERALLELANHAKARGIGDRMKFLHSYLLMLKDQRLLQRSFALLEEGRSLGSALGEVSREATRAAHESGNDFLLNRSRDLEQMCDALLMMATPDARATLPTKAIVVAAQVSIYDLLVTARHKPVAFVVTKSVRDNRHPHRNERTRALLELLGLPAIAGVTNAFKWISPGDIAVLDADHGFLIVNPSRSDIAAHRARSRADQA